MNRRPAPLHMPGLRIGEHRRRALFISAAVLALAAVAVTAVFLGMSAGNEEASSGDGPPMTIRTAVATATAEHLQCFPRRAC